ncbi:MAG: DUF2288 domain-containing protein [Nitrosomonadales bacterium]|nr:DUF2288 domain-containing protein [Nitrosomonadales bacterium]
MIETNKEEIYRAKLNLETAQIAWRELQRFFASGAALHVSADIDLVEVAFQMSEDNAEQIKQWMQAGKLGKVTDEQAAAWYETDALVWGVVVSPWLLVQAAESLH